MSKLSIIDKYYKYIIGFIIGSVFSYWLTYNELPDYITPQLIEQTLTEEVINDSITNIINIKSNDFNTETISGRDSIDSVLLRIRTRSSQ